MRRANRRRIGIKKTINKTSISLSHIFRNRAICVNFNRFLKYRKVFKGYPVVRVKTISLIKKPINFNSMDIRKCEGQMMAVLGAVVMPLRITGNKITPSFYQESEEPTGGKKEERENKNVGG